MIAIVVLFMLGALLPFVFVYGALAWLLFLPIMMGWGYLKPLLIKWNIPRVWLTRIAVAASLLSWIVIIRAAT